MLEDHQLVDQSFTEMVNSLLSTGEVPGLYRPEELDSLLPVLKDRASEEGWRDTLFSYFTHRVHVNLHIALILDCSNPGFFTMCESNPAFYNRCSLQWMDRWRDESMIQVCE